MRTSIASPNTQAARSSGYQAASSHWPFFSEPVVALWLSPHYPQVPVVPPAVPRTPARFAHLNRAAIFRPMPSIASDRLRWLNAALKAASGAASFIEAESHNRDALNWQLKSATDFVTAVDIG